MGGNRRHGFARGNASGRNGQTHAPRWFCCGCQCEHGGQVLRTVLYGLTYCERRANRIETARHPKRLDGKIAFSQLPEEASE